MRNTFASEITKIAQKREDIFLLSGDIGNRMFDKFKEIAPQRFLNCGIAESNMMSMAAGMALSGMRPVVYTITPFTTTRCLEQIRVGVAYHQAPVVIIGTGSGLSYAELGSTHHSLEDLAILRAIPGLNVLAPVDSLELSAQLQEAFESKFPTYIRIGKKGEPILHTDTSKLGIGKANLIREGKDLLVLGVGPILNEAMKAAQFLETKGCSVAIASLGGIKPIDTAFLQAMSCRFSTWVSYEEHSLIGGVGSTLLEWIQTHNLMDKISLLRLGTPDEFIHHLGNQSFVLNSLNLDSHGLVNQLDKLINGS